MLSSRPGLRAGEEGLAGQIRVRSYLKSYINPYLSLGGIGGNASIAPLRAFLKAEKVEQSSRGNSDLTEKSDNTKLHIRPLYTAGDLMLALYELMDARLFSKGYIQTIGDLPVKESPSSWSPCFNLFRVTYRFGKPNKWEYLSPSKRLDSRDEDLAQYLCPYACDSVYDTTPVPFRMETVDMKVWVSNFVRTYKNINSLGGNDSPAPKGTGLPRACPESLQSLTVDVQLIRHIKDSYLHANPTYRSTKAELRNQVRD